METENRYSETDLGNVSPNPRGEYDPKEPYEYLDLVSYQGGSYLCLAELETTITGTAPEPGRNTDIWQMLTLPGNLRPDYIAMHDDVVNKAAQVEISRAAVEQTQQEVEASQADVQQLHEDTVQAAQEAENSRDSAAGYAQSAEQSRKAAAESEQNINAQMTGLNQKVSESVTQATGDITAARQQAIDTITTQEDASVAEVKRVGTAAFDSAEQALQEIRTTGQQAVQAVTDQQNTSVQAVKDETKNYIEEKKREISDKTDEVTQAVNQAGEEQLQNIADSLDSTLTGEGKAADSKAVGDALCQLSIIESASGSEITLDDSAEMPLKGLHIYGKSTQTTTTGAQLFDVSAIGGTNPVEADAQGWYELELNNSNGNETDYGKLTTLPSELLKVGTKYNIIVEIEKISGCQLYVTSTGIEKPYSSQFEGDFACNNAGTFARILETKDDFSESDCMLRTFILVNPGKNGYCKFRLTVCEDITVTENTFSYEPYSAGYPSPSPEYPREIKSVRNPVYKVHGRNLVKSYQSNKTDKPYASTLYAEIDEIMPDTQYVLSMIIADGNKAYINEDLMKFTKVTGDGERKQIVVTTLSNISKTNARLYKKGKGWCILKNDENNTVVSDTKDVQLEIGTVATSYEPYKEQTVTLPYTLNAIPVDSDGNYTAPDGQQWICDEIDFERGVYIQRIYRVDLMEKMTKWNTWGVNAKTEGITGFYSYWQRADLPIPVRKEIVSNIFVHQKNAWGGSYVGSTINLDDKYIICSINTDSLENIDNNEEAIKSFVKLATEKKAYILFAINPIETPLTEEQIASYKALHTYNGTTIIESEADLSLSYVANPKKYIDKKFAELSQAIIASASEAE